MVLTLYVDYMSQPSRALLIFCRMNGIPHQEKVVNLAKKQHQTPEYKSINPLGQVPAIDDNGFKLQESHAILRYLAATKPCSDHWYPSDSSRKAKIDAVLDWHHNNLRRGSAGLVFNKILAPAVGLPIDTRASEVAKVQLQKALSALESVWLKGKEPFLNGFLQPSIADVSLACEVMQLEMLGTEEKDDLLQPFDKVKVWLVNVKEALSPHFYLVHRILLAAASKQKKAQMPYNGSQTGRTNSSRL